MIFPKKEKVNQCLMLNQLKLLKLKVKHNLMNLQSLYHTPIIYILSQVTLVLHIKKYLYDKCTLIYVCVCVSTHFQVYDIHYHKFARSYIINA